MNTQRHITPLTSMYEAYIRAGFALVPIHQGKGPTGSGWNKRENCITSTDQLDPMVGYGIAHAWSSPVTCAIDIDNLSVATSLLKDHSIDLQSLIDAPDSVMIDSGNPGHAKLIYTVPFGMTLPSKKISYTDDTGARQVAYELRCASSNGLTVQDVAPSAVNHPKTGKPYRWSGNGHFSALPTLPTALLSLWQDLSKQDSERTIPTDTINTSFDEIRSALNHIPADCPRDQWLTVAMALHYAGTQVAQLEQALTLFHEWSATGATKYKGPRDIEVVWRSFKPDNGIKTGSLFHIAHGYGYKRPVPDVSTLFHKVEPVSPVLFADGLRIPPPEMDMSLWPEILRTRAIEVSESVGCDPIVPLFAGLSAVCGAINAQTRLQLVPGYEVPPVLWLMTIGDPADKKSPGARPMMGALYQIEKEDRQRFDRALLEWEAMDSVYQQSRKAYMLAAGQNTETILTGKLNNDSLPPIAPKPPEKPVDARLVVNDITSQKLVRIVADRPRGVLCHLDEMASWVSKITDPRSGEDRSCWTKSYEADTYAMDRVGVENAIFASNMAVSIYGNIQPQVFRDQMRPMAKDGLLQRFIPGILRAHYTKRGEPIPDMFSNRDLWEMKIREVYALPMTTYKLDSQAYEAFRDFQLWYETTKSDERLLRADPVYMQAFGKLEGTCGRIMLLLHVLTSPYDQLVTKRTCTDAIKLIKSYVIPAFRYALGEAGGMIDNGLDQWAANRVIQLAGDVSTITLSELRNSARAQLVNTPRHAQNQLISDAMESLEMANWVSLINDHKDKRSWAINPLLATQYADQRLSVLKAKQRRLDESRAIVLGAGKYTPRRFVKGYDPDTME